MRMSSLPALTLITCASVVTLNVCDERVSFPTYEPSTYKSNSPLSTLSRCQTDRIAGSEGNDMLYVPDAGMVIIWLVGIPMLSSLPVSAYDALAVRSSINTATAKDVKLFHRCFMSDVIWFCPSIVYVYSVLRATSRVK